MALRVTALKMSSCGLMKWVYNQSAIAVMTNTTSVHKITWKYLLIVLALSMASLLLISRTGWLAIEEDKLRHHQFESNVLQRQFSEMFGFYQGIARQLSQRTEVADIVQFADRERAMIWAKEVRRLIPESIGVALVNSEGTILGEPLQLNLGAQCVNDLNLLFAGRYVGSPPVHRAIPKLAHFDITQEVERDGEVIGVLFISFSLDVIKQRAEQLITEGQVLLIDDSKGEVVVQQGTNDAQRYHGTGHPWVVIDNTDWKLHYISDEHSANALFVSTLLSVGLFVVVIIALMIMLSLKLIALFKMDLGLIKEQLGGVYSGCRNELPVNRMVLTETCDIMDDVLAMMGNIEQANAHLKQLSVNDELSGLLNRRGFNDQLEQAWELSTRGVTASLVLLDLDHFKQVNDSLGHGTGDEVITALAEALRERCRKSDIIARLGGDEFAVILNSTTEQQSVEQWYGQLAEHFALLQSRFYTDAKPALCTISAGAVPLDKGKYDRLQKQLEAADRALYKAKGQGRGSIVCRFPLIKMG